MRFDLTAVQKEFYSQQVQENYEARGFFFKSMVDYKQEGAKGARIMFEVMEALVGGKVGASGTFSQNSAGGDIEAVWVYPEEYICEYFYRQLEFDQSGEYLKPKYAQRVVDALMVLSDIAVSALLNDDNNFVDRADATPRIVGDGTGILTFELLLAGKALCAKYGVNTSNYGAEGENYGGGQKVYAITDYIGDQALMTLEQFTNIDYISTYTLQNGTMNGLKHLGMEFRVVPNLSDKLYGGYKHIKPGEVVFMISDALAFGSNSELRSETVIAHQRQGAYHTYALANFDCKVLNSNGLTKVKYDVATTLPEGTLEVLGMNTMSLENVIETSRSAPVPMSSSAGVGVKVEPINVKTRSAGANIEGVSAVEALGAEGMKKVMKEAQEATKVEETATEEVVALATVPKVGEKKKAPVRPKKGK